MKCVQALYIKFLIENDLPIALHIFHPKTGVLQFFYFFIYLLFCFNFISAMHSIESLRKCLAYELNNDDWMLSNCSI